MRDVIVGNASTIWIREYIRNIHLPLGNEITVVTLDDVPAEIVSEYKECGVRLVEVRGSGRIGKLSKMAGLIRFFKKRQNVAAVDCIEIHYPPHSAQSSLLAKLIRGVEAKKIITFWGSDILRINENDSVKLEKLVAEADKINIATVEMRRKFKAFYGDKYDWKFADAKFGSLAYTCIKELKTEYTKAECKRKIGLDEKLITVAVGYNAKKSHQHLKALEALSGLCPESKSRIQLMIHLDNVADTEYVKSIENAAEQSGIRTVFIKGMLKLEDVAVLRAATDIFLHTQISDALSGSIRECIYAESILINPSWIKYREYDEAGVEYVEFSEFDEIPDIIENILTGKITVDTNRNAELVYGLYSWDAVRKDWEELFN